MPRLKTKRHSNGTFYAHGTIAGQRIRQTLGTSSKKQAEEACASLEARLWQRSLYGEGKVRTFSEAALSYSESGGEERFLDPITRYFRDWRLADIKPGHIRTASVELMPTAKPSTRNRQVLVPARAVINHAADLGWCSHIRITRFPEDRPSRVSVVREWIDAFMDASDSEHISALALFMFETGARISEALNVEWTDVELADGTVMLRETKTEPRLCHITIEMMVALANLPREHKPFRYAQRWSVYKHWRRACEAAGIEYVPPHQAGRHSFATETLALGIDIPTAMQAGGWKSSKLFLETYAHPDSPSKRVAEAMNWQKSGKGKIQEQR